jgi:hypothetical protein
MPNLPPLSVISPKKDPRRLFSDISAEEKIRTDALRVADIYSGISCVHYLSMIKFRRVLSVHQIQRPERDIYDFESSKHGEIRA